MLRATHVNQTLTIGLLMVIKTMTFSIYMFFLPILAIIQDWDHHAGFMKRYFKFSLPFKHRGFTHTLLFIILFLFIINISIFLYQKGLYLSDKSISLFNIEEIKQFLIEQKTNNMFLFVLLHGHLLGDFFTKRGIPYLYPIIKKPIGIGIFTTGEGINGKISGEMFINFIHSIINIGLLTIIISGWEKYAPFIKPIITNIKNSTDINLIIFLIGAEIIFIIFLFWSDIKNYAKYWSEFIKRLFKVLIFTGTGLFIVYIINLLLNIYNINLTNILLSISNNSINIPNLNTIVSIGLLGLVMGFALYLTKKYIISLASSIAYIINVTYIFLSLSLFLIF